MPEFDAFEFVGFMNGLHSIGQTLEGVPDDEQTLQALRETAAQLVRGGMNQLERMGLPASRNAARELLACVEVRGADNELGRMKIGFLRRVLRYELEGRSFVQISRQDLYDNNDIFGADVGLCFPRASYDISEAGKCLALGRSTACVFHLMRVVELGIARLGEALEIEAKPRWGWQKLLNDALEPAINKLPEGTDIERQRKKELQQARAHLHAIRLGWRNDTMHPKETYTNDEAEALVMHVKTFMFHLAKHL